MELLVVVVFFPSICYHCICVRLSPLPIPTISLFASHLPLPFPTTTTKKKKKTKKTATTTTTTKNHIPLYIYTRPSTCTHLCYYLFSSCIPLHVCHTYTCTSTPFPCYLYPLVSYLYSTCCTRSYVFCLTTLYLLLCTNFSTPSSHFIPSRPKIETTYSCPFSFICSLSLICFYCLSEQWALSCPPLAFTLNRVQTSWYRMQTGVQCRCLRSVYTTHLNFQQAQEHCKEQSEETQGRKGNTY